MKRFRAYGLQLVIAFVLLTYTSVYAQISKSAPQEPKTKLEAFETQTGTVMIKGYQEIGSVSGLGTVSVECMEFTDAATGKRQMGIIIDVKASGRLEREGRSFIDYDEIDPLLKGIDYISKVTSASTRLGNFEAIYKTKGDFNVTTFSGSAGKVEAAIKAGYIGGATAYISITKLADLRTFISQAKQRLDSIK
jgi:hypothetical protein